MNNYRPALGLTPAVKAILIANVLVFLLVNLTGGNLVRLLGLHLPQSEYFHVHQYLTHMFTHEGFSHLFFNMFAVFMFGKILESVWGTRRFVLYYLVTGLGAALLHSLVSWYGYHNLVGQFEAFQNAPDPGVLAEFVRAHYGDIKVGVPVANGSYAIDAQKFIDAWLSNPDLPGALDVANDMFRGTIRQAIDTTTIGASGAVFGILLAFGMLFPNTELFIMFLPIPIKAKYFVLGYGAIELFFGIQNFAGDNVAHFAHLGGMLFGYFLIRYWRKHGKQFY